MCVVSQRLFASALLVLGASHCGAVFPRYTTATRAVPDAVRESGSLAPAPASVRTMRVVSAVMPAMRPDGQPWDGDNGPDPFVVVSRNNTEVHRSPVVSDTTTPQWQDPGQTLFLTPDSLYRFELRDEDGVLDDPISVIESTGVPDGALASGVWRVTFPNGATLRVELAAPTPRLGMGVTYEVHEDALVVIEVEPASPGNTAGLQRDDQIEAIDGQHVSALGERGSRQAMDRAATRDVTLSLRRRGAPHEVIVRSDAVYPARKP